MHPVWRVVVGLFSSHTVLHKTQASLKYIFWVQPSPVHNLYFEQKMGPWKFRNWGQRALFGPVDCHRGLIWPSGRIWRPNTRNAGGWGLLGLLGPRPIWVVWDPYLTSPECIHPKRRFSRLQNSADNLNFPQKDCLRMQKISKLHCLQSYWRSFPLLMFCHCNKLSMKT